MIMEYEALSNLSLRVAAFSAAGLGLALIRERFTTQDGTHWFADNNDYVPLISMGIDGIVEGLVNNISAEAYMSNVLAFSATYYATRALVNARRVRTYTAPSPDM